MAAMRSETVAAPAYERFTRGVGTRVVDWAGSEGSFSYYGQDQEWHARWAPPEKPDQSQTIPQLPQLVRLGGLPHDRFPTIVAAPRGSPFPRPLPPDLLLGGAPFQN